MSFVAALRKPSSFIVGGDEVAPNSEPYVVSLQRSGAHFCGASLAGYLNKAITAGHCHNSYGVTAVAGAHRIELYESRSQSRSVTQFIVHPSYNSYLLENDIAIIKLSSPFVENEYVKPLFLPRQVFQDWLPHNSPVRVCGWGNTVPGDVPAEMAKELHCIDVNVIAYSICNDRQHYNGELSPGMMCAGVDGVGGKDACGGDSGGPVKYGDMVVGITSWSYGHPHQGQGAYYPGVYTDVAWYRNWIDLQ